MQLTVKKMKEMLSRVPDDSIIRFQRIEDKYIEGRNEKSLWLGEESELSPVISNTQGWTTYDMPCDCASESYCNNFPKFCPRCENRNQYIEASRCFIHGGELFIDGHY